ncbi:hypothetical protein C1X68_27520 [Pseudomonas sp. FW303-C2]|nr:hypothetical protein C1X70_01110 [Pseudomonas sp. FW305-53]PMY83832.1 hypothetical protein C1X68_27520 [Pseudomonas sp. FW303-C2]
MRRWGRRPIRRITAGDDLWRGSLLPLGCAAAPKPFSLCVREIMLTGFGSASHSSGSKPPRHRDSVRLSVRASPRSVPSTPV